MSFITRRPSQRLAGIVERLWRVEDLSGAATPETICPDGCPEIVIHLEEPMRGQPRHLLVGQMPAPITVTPHGRVTMLGARLTPAGLSRLLPMPQEAVRGAILSLDSVWPAWTRRAVDQMGSERSSERQLALFERALEVLVSTTHTNVDPAVAVAVHAMRVHRGPVNLDRLATVVGISRRQLERRFRDRVGLGLHLFGRIVRFQHAFAAIGHEPGAALAARLGYVDQAHLVREVRRFSGRTPLLLADAEGLTSFFANAASK